MGDHLATTSADLTLRLWEIGNPLAVAVFDVGDYPSWVYWSADDRYLAYQSQSPGVTVIHSQLTDLIELACADAVRNLGESEPAQYLANLSTEFTCSKALKPGVDYPDPYVSGSRG